jgi:DNA-binding transcriptional MerR regulator
VNLDELCAEVNRVLEARGISVPDGRTASVVTPRNVRYYRTIGLMQPPSRSGGRAEYQQEHLDEIVEIKKAQHEGISLEQLLELRKREWDVSPEISFNANLRTSEIVTNTIFRNVLSHSLSSVADVRSQEEEHSIGWSIRFGEIVISGPGAPPTGHQIAAIRKVFEIDD